MPLPNMQELTQKLATMSDAQMQQYAQMHQADPYVLAMAVSEKNRRAAMRAGAAAQQQQPTVAQQEIGSMAGLSALPAANMERMAVEQAAGGGVIGFGAGGIYDVPGMITDPVPAWANKLRDREATAAQEPKKLLPAFWEALMTGRTVEDVRGGPDSAPPAQTAPDTPVQPSIAAEIGSPMQGLAALAAKQRQGAAPAVSGPSPARDTPPAAAATAPAAPAPKTEAAPQPAPIQKSAPAETNDVAARMRRFLQPALDAKDELIERQDGLTEQELAAAKDQLTAFDKRAKETAPVGSEREKRLRQQEAGLFSQEGQALGNAAMRGFLAILGGTSRSRRVNIARGLAVGLNSFDKRMAQVEARRAEINKNLDQIETLREQAASASAEKRAAIEARVEAVRANGAKASFDLYKTLGYDLNKDIGIASFTAAEEALATEKKQAFESREKQLDRNVSTANSIRAANASAAPKAPKAFDLQGKYAEYLLDYEKAAAGNSNPLGTTQPRMSLQQFAQAMGILPTVSTLPESGAVVLPRK